MTQDAASAPQCLRVCKHHQEDLVCYLLDRGIPFTTWIPSSIPFIPPYPSGPPPPSIHSIGLGCCDMSYKPDAVDYMAYQEQRDVFFHHPHAHTALLRGGIVWCVAMQSISQDAVLVGPTYQVFTHGQAFQTSDGTYWWDDDLSEDELNLIYGVYKVFTDMSWWPKSAIWQRGNLDVGYWSHACKEWFQNWLTHILNGSTNVRSAKKWGSSLVLLKKQGKLATKNAKLVERYILHKE
ncbi:hypothetical protein BU17DRAFT_51571 [Hysterangium stoloniferum]|nr:hypothetical protein BU17DRAFT_51571 [Hysterangium stoloniferum]